MPISHKVCSLFQDRLHLGKTCLDKDSNLTASFIILASLLLSAWMIAIDPTVNRDGIFYLLTAEAYIDKGLGAALAQYNWPWFLLLPATLHQLTGVELHQAALFSTSLWFALFTYAFVRLIKHLGGGRTTQLFALVIILFHPMIANYRSGIGRDAGFWAFSLLAMAEAISFAASYKLKRFLLWASYAVAATLFRVEGFILILSTPVIVLALYFKEHQHHIQLKGRHYGLLAIAMAVLAAILSMALSKDLKLFSELSFHAGKLFAIQDEWSTKSEQLGRVMLAHTSAEKDAGWALFGGYLGLYTATLARTFTPLYFILIGYFLFTPAIKPLQQKHWRLIYATAAVVALYLFAFTINRGFLIKRYSLQLFIFLALCLPFIVHYLWHSAERTPKYTKAIQRSILLVLFFYAADTLHTSDAKKSHLREAANWIGSNSSPNAYVVSNDGNVAYFSYRKTNWLTAIHGKTEAYQLAHIKPDIIYAIRIKYDEQAGNQLIQSPQIRVLKIFDGPRGDKVVIYTKA